MKWIKSDMWSKSDESDIPKEVFEDAEKAYDYAEEIGKRIPELEDVIAKDPEYSYKYADTIIKGRFLKGEDAISKDPEFAYFYAIDVIKDRWPKGEDAIAKDHGYSYLYINNVIKGRWTKGENILSKDPTSAYEYATTVIKDRFPKGEDAILKSYRKKEYLNFLKSKGYDTEELFGEESVK